MIDVETNPGTAVLVALFGAFVLLGFATLSGTLALVIWLAIGTVALVLAYAGLTRVAQWARGQRGGGMRGG